MLPRSSLSSGSNSSDHELAIKASNFKAERETPSAKLIDLLIKEESEGQQTRRLLHAALSQLDSSSQRAINSEMERQKVESYFAQAIKMTQADADAEEQIFKAQMQAETYKIQLQHAQKEAERAQLLLKQLEAQREHAEKSAIKAKELARRLKEEKAVVVAREGGRREGFEEGLKRGRLIALAHEEARRMTFPSLPAIEGGTAFERSNPTESARSRRHRKDTERSERRSRSRKSSELSKSQRRRRKSSERRQRRDPSPQIARASSGRDLRDSAPQLVRASSHGEPPLPISRQEYTGPSTAPSSLQSPQPLSQPLPPRAARPMAPQGQSAQPQPPVIPRVVPHSTPQQPHQASRNSPLAAQPTISQNPGKVKSDSILSPSLRRNVPEPAYDNIPPNPEPRIPQVIVEPAGPVAPPPPKVHIPYLPMPPPPAQPPAHPAPLPLSFAPSDISQPRLQATRSSPDIMNSPASTSMTGLSSQLGSHLLSFPGGNTLGRDERPGHVMGLTSIPEDVSGSSPRTGTPSGAWPQREGERRRLNTRRSTEEVEEWRNSTELAVPPNGFGNSSARSPSAGSTRNQYLQPPDSADSLHRRPSNGSGHSIEFSIVPPSRPSSVVMGDENQHSGFLSPNRTAESISPAPDPDEPPVVPSRTGYTPPVGAPYPNQPEVPVFEPHQLPPGFIPHVMTNHDGSVVDLRAGRVISTPSISSSSPYPPSTSRQPTPNVPYSHPFPPPAAIAGPSMDELTSTFGSFELSQGRQPPKGILVNGGTSRSAPPAYPTQPAPAITFSRSLSDIPGVAMTSPESNISSPRRRRMSLYAGKTPAGNYQMLPPGSHAGSRSSTPAGMSPMVFARPPPRSETSSAASHRSHGSNFIPPMMTMPEPHLNPNPPPFIPSMTMPEPSFVPRMPEPVIPSEPSDDDSDNESYVPDQMTLANTQFNARGSGWSNPGMPMPYR